MKKILLFFGIFLFVTSPVFAGSFPDVPEDHENYEAIEYLDSNGVIHGYEDGTFGPDNLVNRAEAMKIIVGAFGIDHSGSYDVIFPDVPESEWFFPYVMAGLDANIIDGYDDGAFRPGDNINMAEVLKIIIMAGNVELPTSIETDIFIDVPGDSWYAPHALYARDHNLVLSDDYGYLHAEQYMTRAKVAELIYRMTVVLENDGEPYSLDENWDLYVSDILPFKMKYDSDNWDIIENDNEIVFFRRDKEFMQFSPSRIYPNCAVVRVVLDNNDVEMDVNQYFANIKLAFGGAEHTHFSLQDLDALEVLYPDKRIADWYVYLGNGDVLAIYTEFGNGGLGYQLTRFIQAMLSTFEYNEIDYEVGEDYSQLLSEIFENVLVEGKGMESLDKLPDKLIIETDSIGVGTGPIDYYYSEGVDYTFKYERTSDVILDTREGETTAF